MHQADFPVWWGGVGTKYLRYRQQNKCGVINFHETQIGGEVISLGGEASLLASSTGSQSQRASVFRRAEQKTIRTVELQCSRALLPSSLFAAARLRPLEMLKHTLSTCCSFAGRVFLCTATHSDLFLQPGYLFKVLFEPAGHRWAHVCPVRMCELPVFCCFFVFFHKCHVFFLLFFHCYSFQHSTFWRHLQFRLHGAARLLGIPEDCHERKNSFGNPFYFYQRTVALQDFIHAININTVTLDLDLVIHAFSNQRYIQMHRAGTEKKKNDSGFLLCQPSKTWFRCLSSPCVKNKIRNNHFCSISGRSLS